MWLHRIRIVMFVVGASALGLPGAAPVAQGAPPPQERVDTPQEHFTEDHVIHDGATEDRLQTENVHGLPTAQPANTAPSPTRICPRSDPEAWHARKREVIDRASGVCARCGLSGADTAYRDWNGDDLLAVHTRCVLGLGSPSTHTGHHAA
jgi:hypothetical protein